MIHPTENHVDHGDKSGNSEDNRSSLLEIANKFQDSFELPMYHSPGAFFFGASLRPIDYDIPDYPEYLVGVGGRGETLQQAFESCVGEACEFLSFLEHKNDPLLITPKFHFKIESELVSWFMQSLGLTDSDELYSTMFVEASSLVDRSNIVLFPADLVLRRPRNKRLAKLQTESNGLGAGPTQEDAILSGLLEVIERDAIALWWYGGNRASRIDPDILKDSGFGEFAKRIRNSDGRKWWQLDITSDLEIPTVATISSENDGSHVVVGFSAGLTIIDAMKRSFLEMCQMEVAQDISLAKLEFKPENELTPKDLQWIDRANKLNTHSFPELEKVCNKRKRLACNFDSLQQIVKRLMEKKFQPYFVDISRNSLGVSVAKVLVPGLQSPKIKRLTPRIKAVMRCNQLSTDICNNRIAIL